MRLCLARKDYIRTQIISKKISTKFFSEEGTDDLKLKYYELMITLDQHEGSYLAVCKHYRAISDTKSIQDDPEKRKEALKCVVIYLILAPYDNEQSDLIHRVKEDNKSLEEILKHKELLTKFTTSELMNWREICQEYETELRKGPPDSTSTAIFSAKNKDGSKNEDGIKRWEDLKVRVVEHNIRVMANYYTRIHMVRMAELLDLTQAETEEFLSNLVVNKTVQAKIDRLDGVVHFRKGLDPNDILNEWSHNVNSLMQLVNKTTLLITKEEMVHKLH
jgi:26S proteasome regulatory subunit N5